MTKLEGQIERLGELAASLGSAAEVRSNVLEPPPPGAARFQGRDGDDFQWQPIDQAEWQALSPATRGQILVERGKAWLDLNGEIKASPIAFVDSAAAIAGTERLFGERVRTLREAICLVHRLLKENPVRARALMLIVGGTLLVATGLHSVAITTDVLELLVEIYAAYYCPPTRDT
jgi:hypothetical protein